MSVLQALIEMELEENFPIENRLTSCRDVTGAGLH